MTRQTARKSRWIDPETLMRIKNLQVRARIVVEGYLSGIHRSPYHGFSVEFSEYRQYTVGDDLRYLDWKLLARSDRYFIKRFEDETNLRCHLLVDLSRSMGFGTVGYTKADYARTLAGTLAYFLSLQRDAAGLLTFDEAVADYLPARYRPGHLQRMMVALERAEAGGETNLVLPIEQIAKTVTKRGVIVLISDLLSPTEALEQHLAYLRTRGHEVVLFRVLDPRELDFQFDDPSMFFDLETQRQLYIDPAAVRDDYLRKFADHEAALRQICERLGIDFVQMSTERPLERSLFDFLSVRQTKGRLVARRSSPGNRSAG